MLRHLVSGQNVQYEYFHTVSILYVQWSANGTGSASNKVSLSDRKRKDETWNGNGKLYGVEGRASGKVLDSRKATGSRI